MKSISMKELVKLVQNERIDNPDNKLLPYICVPLNAVIEHWGMSRSGLISMIGRNELDRLEIECDRAQYKAGIMVSTIAKYEKENDVRISSIIVPVLIELYKKLSSEDDVLPMYYSTIMEIVNLSWRNPYHRDLIGRTLGHLSQLSFASCKVLVSALIVRRDTGTPSDVFFWLASQPEIGKYNSDEQTKAEYYRAELRDVAHNKKQLLAIFDGLKNSKGEWEASNLLRACQRID